MLTSCEILLRGEKEKQRLMWLTEGEEQNQLCSLLKAPLCFHVSVQTEASLSTVQALSICPGLIWVNVNIEIEAVQPLHQGLTSAVAVTLQQCIKGWWPLPAAPAGPGLFSEG